MLLLSITGVSGRLMNTVQFAMRNKYESIAFNQIFHDEILIYTFIAQLQK